MSEPLTTTEDVEVEEKETDWANPLSVLRRCLGLLKKLKINEKRRVADWLHSEVYEL